MSRLINPQAEFFLRFYKLLASYLYIFDGFLAKPKKTMAEEGENFWLTSEYL